ncbi:phage shock protein PspC (stress-responsive transcriptional regulator) [Silvimonas terrae]|uniref:Phage shock protein PspC (Stress-responsive transcriptional regulator) n=1 Tax=Silvimonas terrae TaxID=300266 RepID=A0A840RG11_9NEIS|nr:PspC domain-containing protein [Silvimonas terrae]MBB5191987.1 phage shock protein PspC (stress-responsive transcriptional regulator) [Silvimonas terrae]
MEEKRMRRSRHNKWVAGVIGGMGDYLSISADKLRIVFILLSICVAGFPGLILYLILWFLMPTEE